MALLAIVLLVIVISSVNVANLLLSRGASRSTEMETVLSSINSQPDRQCLVDGGGIKALLSNIDSIRAIWEAEAILVWFSLALVTACRYSFALRQRRL